MRKILDLIGVKPQVDGAGRTLTRWIIVLLVFAVLVLIGQSILNLGNLDEVDESIESMHRAAEQLEELAREISTPMADIRQLSMEMAIAPNDRLSRQAEARIEEKSKLLERRFDDWRRKLDADQASPEELEMFSLIQSAWADYDDALSKTRYYIKQKIRVAAFISLTHQEQEEFDNLQRDLTIFRQYQLEQSQKVYESAHASSEAAYFTQVVAAVIAICVIQLILLFVYRMVRSYVNSAKAHELALAKAKETAEEGAKEKSEFLANMSHEIRTPMNAIIGFSDLALSSPAHPEKIRTYVENVSVAAHGLLTIINSILDFSKIEAGKLTLESIGFNLPKTIQNSLDTLSVQADEKGLDLQFSYAEDLPAYVKGDPMRLRQVVLNIVGNAIKFTELGSIKVDAEKVGDAIQFRVVDTGIGMTPEEKKTIFRPFTQAESNTTRRFGGTGLGTTISQQIIEAMGGDIWVESEVGVGSIFYFKIKLPATSECNPSSDVYEIDQKVVRSPRLFNLLLVEDVELNRELIRLNLADKLGHTVTSVTNGQEAIDVICKQGHHFDIVLMDIHMPVMDGLTATKKIRSWEVGQSKRTPIIALTASALIEDVELTKQVGMDGFVTKPVNIPTLLAEMERVAPENIGIASTETITSGKPEANDMLNPVSDIADIPAALETWFSPEEYTKGLLLFADTHSEDAHKLQRLLQAGQVDEAKRVAHTLKGISLGLTEVSNTARLIDKHLGLKDVDTAELHIPTLKDALQKACSAIRKL